jgi:ATPase subunit of ABC transporter with duplicated ATPase domains
MGRESVEPLLKSIGLTKSVDDGNGGRRTLFADVSAEVWASDRIALTGPSGQGKSTLLRLLAL